MGTQVKKVCCFPPKIIGDWSLATEDWRLYEVPLMGKYKLLPDPYPQDPDKTAWRSLIQTGHSNTLDPGHNCGDRGGSLPGSTSDHPLQSLKQAPQPLHSLRQALHLPHSLKQVLLLPHSPPLLLLPGPLLRLPLILIQRPDRGMLHSRSISKMAGGPTGS